MAGGKNKIHEHPNAGKNTFRERKQDINKKGQPPKLLRHFNDEMKAAGYERVTPSQVAEAYEVLFNLPEEQVDEIAKDIKRPFFLRKVAIAMGTAKGIEMIEKMLDRVHGKATQTTQITGVDGNKVEIQVTHVGTKGK